MRIFKTLVGPFIALMVIIVAVISFIYCDNFTPNQATMISGLWSAFATVILGGIAVWQNMRYKAQSDIASENTEKIQVEIKELNKNSLAAIETLTNIEKIKYFPMIEKLNYDAFAFNKEAFLNKFPSSDYVFQVNLYNVLQTDISLPVEELVEKYNSYSFIVKNTSEKHIRDFNCKNLKINNNEFSFIINCSCDISPGECAVVTIVGIPGYEKGKNIDVYMNFVYKNLIMDLYTIEYSFTITLEDDIPEILASNFSIPEKLQEDETNVQDCFKF